MTYFKIINNGEAVDAGWMWLHWNAKHKCLMVCEPREAHYVQNYTETATYRFGWLNPLPDGAPMYPAAEGAIIDADEYNDLIEILDDGETVPEPDDPEPEPEPGGDDTEPEPDPEHRMTIAEMREAIAELTSMTAKDNYTKGSYFVLHDIVYQATRAIVKGSEVKPGYNCIQKSLGDLN